MAGLTRIKSDGIGDDCDLDGEGTLVLDSTNNRVGIGTSSPSRTLTISASDPRIGIIDTDAGGAFQIRNTSGAGYVITEGAHPLLFYTNNSEAARIDSSGRLLVGTTSALDKFDTNRTPRFQVSGTSKEDSSISITRWNAGDIAAPVLFFGGTNNNTAGTYTLVSDDEALGEISFEGTDGSKFVPAAKIEALVDGTPDADDMPGRLVFSTTADEDSSPTERMRIDSSGNVGIGTTAPSGMVHAFSQANTATFIADGEVDNPGYPAYGFAGQNLDNGTRGAGMYLPGDGQLAFSTVAAERMRIDSSGRLLVGTSTVTTTASTSTNNLLAVESTNNYSGVSFTANCNDSNGSYLVLKKSRGTATGSTTVVQSGDEIGNIFFEATDGSASRSAAAVRAFVDGTPGAADMPGRLVFYTTADGASSPTERMRLNSLGSFKVTSDGTYESGADIQNHIIQQHNSSRFIIANTHASEPYGFYVTYPNADPNNASSDFLYCDAGSSSTLRAAIRSNGGLANYSSNNSNLCDEREKKNIETLDSTWGCLKNWELKKFHYNEDDDSDDKRYGVIAQQVAPHCPELITNWVKQQAKDAVLDDDGNVVTPAVEEVNRMAVKEQQMMWMAIKALQEAQARIETLEAKVAALEAG